MAFGLGVFPASGLRLRPPLTTPLMPISCKRLLAGSSSLFGSPSICISGRVLQGRTAHRLPSFGWPARRAAAGHRWCSAGRGLRRLTGTIANGTQRCSRGAPERWRSCTESAAHALQDPAERFSWAMVAAGPQPAADEELLCRPSRSRRWGPSRLLPRLRWAMGHWPSPPTLMWCALGFPWRRHWPLAVIGTVQRPGDWGRMAPWPSAWLLILEEGWRWPCFGT